MSVEIVTAMNRIPDRNREPYYRPDIFFKSLERFGVKPTVLGLNEPWGGLMTKIRRLREWLRAGQAKAETLIWCDSYDVVFAASPGEVGEEYRRGWPTQPIVFNTEKAMFPPSDLVHKFEDVPGPWKYLNGGFMVGPPARILALLEAMWLDEISDDYQSPDTLHGGAGRWIHPNEQYWYQLQYAAQVVPIELDHQARLCQTLSGCELSEFDLTEPSIKNIATGTHPLVHHYNGSAKNFIMPAFLKHMGLE